MSFRSIANEDETSCTYSEASVARGRRFVLEWSDIENYQNSYPELQQDALRIIENFISYLPVPVVCIPHEPFIRSLIAMSSRGGISQDELIDELNFHCKQIRNDDMKKHGFANKRLFDEQDRELYDTCLAQHKQAARNRLAEFIDYEPPVEYSMQAEVYLRQLFAMDCYHADMPSCMLDYRAVTIFRYQEYLSLLGPSEADKSPLVGALLCEQTKLPKENLLKLRLFS